MKLAEQANNALKAARTTQQQKLRKMSLDKTAKVRPDDLKKAGDRMEKAVKAGEGEVKKITDSVKKVLEESERCRGNMKHPSSFQISNGCPARHCLDLGNSVPINVNPNNNKVS